MRRESKMTDEERKRKLQLRMRLANWEDDEPEGYLSRVWEDVKDIPSSMIDPSSDFYRLPRQVKNRVDKDLEATAQMIMSPIETGKGFALSAGAGADRLLGTNLIEDEEQEEQVIQALKGAGGQFVDEIKNFGENPVDSIANLSVVGGPLSLLGKIGKMGKVAKVGRALEMADPLSLAAKGGAGAARGIKDKVSNREKGGRVAAAKETITSDEIGLKQEVMLGAIGIMNNRGVEVMKELWTRLKSPASRKVIDEGLKKGKGAAADAESKFIEASVKIYDEADALYEAAVGKLKNTENPATGTSVWETVIPDDPQMVVARLFDDALEGKPGVVQSIRSNSSIGSTSFRLNLDELGFSDASAAAINRLFDKYMGVAKNSRKGGFTISDLDVIKQGLRDEAAALFNGGAKSEQAAQVFNKMGKTVRETLEGVPGYGEAMKDYSSRIGVLEELEDLFGLKRDFGFDADRKGLAQGEMVSQKNLGDSIQKAFNSSDADALPRQKALSKLEDAAGDPHIGDRILAAKMEPIFASGLVGKSETMSSFKRFGTLLAAGAGGGYLAGGAGGAVAALGAGAGLAVLGIPAYVLLSPRAGAAALSWMIERGLKPNNPSKLAKGIDAISDQWKSKTKGRVEDGLLGKLRESNLTLGEALKAVESGSRPTRAAVRINEEQVEQGKQNSIFRMIGR